MTCCWLGSTWPWFWHLSYEVSGLYILAKVGLMFKSKSLINVLAEGRCATLLDRPPARDLSVNQLQKRLFRQLPVHPLTWNSWTLQITAPWSTARNLFKGRNSWNDVSWTLFLPPPSHDHLFLSFSILMLTGSPCNPFRNFAGHRNWFLLDPCF